MTLEEKKVTEIKRRILEIIEKKKALFISNNIKLDVITDKKYSYFIIFEKKKSFAQIIITKPDFAPYDYVCFEIFGLRKENDRIYYWYDNEETTIQDIIENIDKALDYFIAY